ncbi:MAG: 4-hydroxythreonine-4-phosphate dehydrogenase PdxA [Petrimonas sp.]|nr:4-hydroxythreonine-4-phosphate dehydrogenase PdxA [Petrimonas sp.]
MSKRVKVGITHGDLNGIGYEIIFKAFSDSRLLDIFTPVIYGSAKAASYYRKVLNCKPLPFNFIDKAEECRDGKINFVNCIREEVKIDMGMPTDVSGEAAFRALDCAVNDLEANNIDVLVTLPICKDTIQSKDFHFPGHTEFLQERFAKKGEQALMIMVSEFLRVALVTTHMPLSEVPKSISTELIKEKIKILDYSLKRDFRVENPRIAVLSLNPHAGENGLLGNEEQEIILPAIEEMQKKDNILCSGPFAADGFFGTGRFRDFDAVLAMYHDQGLIPFKAIAMESGVNFTAGLPVVRTSPDHGTAYDIVGKNQASIDSFLQAIYTAIDIFNNRKAYDEAHANPLNKMFFDRGKDDEKLDLTKEEEID